MYKFDPKRDPNEKLIAGSRPSIGPLFFSLPSHSPFNAFDKISSLFSFSHSYFPQMNFNENLRAAIEQDY